MKLGIGNYEAILGAQLKQDREAMENTAGNTRREGQAAQHGEGTNGLFHSGGGFRSQTFITNWYSEVMDALSVGICHPKTVTRDGAIVATRLRNLQRGTVMKNTK